MAGVEGRVALVTGAGSADGIGFATARLLRASGARVAITSTTERIYDRLEELDGGPEGTFAKPADLTDAAAVAALIEEVTGALGPIDIVVNNAGMVQVGRDEPTTLLHETSDKGWRYGIDINLTTAFLVTRAVLQGMIDRNHGRIVQMASVTGPVVGIPGSAVYGAAKAGLEASWQVLNDLKERGTAALDDWNAACAASPWGRADARMLTGSDRVREIEDEFLTDQDRRDYDTTWGH